MCGIVGIIDPLNTIENKKELITTLNDTQNHRGPDDSGYYNDQYISLGFKRLSIIDIYKGNQPIKKKHTITIFNGEIYNFLNLKEELISLGAEFYSDSDSEVVANAFLYWGIKCVEKFDGMFAICFYDIHSKEIYLVRDRMGIKPLHYTFFKKSLIFSSELITITKIPGFEKEMNFNAISSYLSFRYPADDQNLFFNNIKRVNSGSYLKYKLHNNKYELKNYWNLPKLNDDFYNKTSEDEYKDRLDYLLNESVKSQLVSDVPLGVLISGGLDSSLIASIASQYNPNLKTFSISFHEHEYDESSKAYLVSNFIKSKHKDVKINKNFYLDNLETIIDIKGAPASIPHEFAIYHLSKVIKTDVSVLLSGEGADEFFGGYSRVQKSPFDYHKVNFYKKKLDKDDFFNFYLKRYKWFSIEEKNALFKKDINQIIDNEAVNKPFRDIFINSDYSNSYNVILETFQKNHIKCLLDRLDLMTMSSSIEARVPFLGHKILDFINQVPFNYKIKWKSILHKYLSIFSNSEKFSEKNDINKYLLRSCSAKYLPKKTKNEKKLGFPLPMNEWMKDKKIEDIFMDSSTLNRGIFDKKYLIQMYKNNTNSQNNLNFDFSGKKIWMLVNLELWMRKFF